MFYAKMNDDDEELPRYEDEDEGLEHPHDGDVVEEGEETIVEIGMGEEEPEPSSPPPARKPAAPARKKASKAAPKKKAKAKPKAKAKAKSSAKKKKGARKKKR
jgi:hypothetical protein